MLAIRVDRILCLTIGTLDRAEPGHLTSRVTSDTTLLRQITAESLTDAVNGILITVMAHVLMGLLEPVLLGVTPGRVRHL